jgi:hypothetical protein
VLHRVDRERAEHVLDRLSGGGGDAAARAPEAAEEFEDADEAGHDRSGEEEEPLAAVPRLVQRRLRTGDLTTVAGLRAAPRRLSAAGQLANFLVRMLWLFVHALTACGRSLCPECPRAQTGAAASAAACVEWQRTYTRLATRKEDPFAFVSVICLVVVVV